MNSSKKTSASKSTAAKSKKTTLRDLKAPEKKSDQVRAGQAGPGKGRTSGTAGWDKVKNIQ